MFLSKFPITPLPKSFLDFSRPPFNFPIQFQYTSRFIFLIDGAFVKFSASDSYSCSIISDYIQTHFSNYSFPIPFLKLSGENVTEITFFNLTGQRCSYKSIYIDEFGISDEGFKRHKYLTLSEEKIQQLVEDLLTYKIEYD